MELNKLSLALVASLVSFSALADTFRCPVIALERHGLWSWMRLSVGGSFGVNG
ncbi:hypothetical protein JCM19239_4866 [Vibrio variabilis]|uniref:Uncharacterized protein n=1 Tax=Vibrio variabilis TaxID=990271 RepID=A0ABQ0JI37_9VIBR|nr:hypothetical protein JCM19239_4866 [Vibrio variabilis]